MITFPSSLFSYNAARRTFSSEASTLEGNVGPIAKTIAIKSLRTGIEMVFVGKTQTINKEGEILSWNFVDRDGSGIRAIVFND